MVLLRADFRLYRDLNLFPVLSWSSSMVPPHLCAQVRSVCHYNPQFALEGATYLLGNGISVGNFRREVRLNTTFTKKKERQVPKAFDIPRGSSEWVDPFPFVPPCQLIFFKR